MLTYNFVNDRKSCPHSEAVASEGVLGAGAPEMVKKLFRSLNLYEAIVLKMVCGFEALDAVGVVISARQPAGAAFLLKIKIQHCNSESE